jgi:hypothetical protein
MARTRGFGRSSGGGEESFDWKNLGSRSSDAGKMSTYGKALVSPPRGQQQKFWQDTVSSNVNALVSPPRRWQPQQQSQPQQQYQPPLPQQQQQQQQQQYQQQYQQPQYQPQEQLWQENVAPELQYNALSSPSSVMSSRTMVAKQRGFGRSSGGGETTFNWNQLGGEHQSPFAGYTRPNHEYGQQYEPQGGAPTPRYTY